MTGTQESLRDRIARALVDVAHDFGHGEAVVVNTSTAADAVLAVIGADLARLTAQTEARGGTGDQLCVHRSSADIDRLSTSEDVVQELVGLLNRSGWRRLEAWRGSSADRVGGYCVDAGGRSVQVGT